MADSGFDIDDLLCGMQVGLNHPPFLSGKDQLDGEEIIETRRIASLRIHVERVIERVKNYRTLYMLPVSLCSGGSRLVRVCTFLTTLLQPLVPPPEMPSSTGS